MARLCQERPYGFRFNTSPQEQHQAGYDNSRGPVSEREEHFFLFFFSVVLSDSQARGETTA